MLVLPTVTLELGQAIIDIHTFVGPAVTLIKTMPLRNFFATMEACFEITTNASKTTLTTHNAFEITCPEASCLRRT